MGYNRLFENVLMSNMANNNVVETSLGNDAENDEEYPHKWLDEMEALERELIEPELTSGINP